VGARNAASFARRKARFLPQPTVLVLCEDSKASVAYLNDAAHHFRASPSMRVTHASRTDPLGAGMSHYNKGNLQGLFDRLFQEGRLATALQNAQQAAADADAVGEPNPSTQLHRLIDRIEALGRLAPL
jgi:hypothetical protein